MSWHPTDDVLMVGWHFRAVDALRLADRRAVSVVSAGELYRIPPQIPRADLIVVPDANSAEDVLTGLARHDLAPGDFAAVHSMREFALVTASLLAGQGATAGLPLRTALALRDKYLQKQLVRAAGLPTAGCRVVDSLAALRADPPSLPCVIKPLAGAGTFNTHAIHTAQDLATLVEGPGPTSNGPWLVEDFVEGRELHIDGVVRDGRIAFLAVSRYLNNVIDMKTGAVVGSATLHPSSEPACYQQADELTSTALSALGLREGIFHLEAFQRDDGLVFSECAGRIGGGVVQDTVIHAFGVDLLAEWARAVAGRPSSLTTAPPRPGNSGWVHLQADATRTVALPPLDVLENRPGCVSAGFDPKGSRVIPDPTVSSNARVAWAVLHGLDETQVADHARQLTTWFRESARGATLPA